MMGGMGVHSTRVCEEGAQHVQDYAIFLLDPQGYVLTWNEAAQRIKGYQAHEILGQHFSCFYPPEEVRRGTPASGLRVAAQEGRWEHEGWRVRKDGTRFWADVVLTALYDDDGTLVGFAKVTRDLSERKRAEENHHRAGSRRCAAARDAPAAVLLGANGQRDGDAARRRGGTIAFTATYRYGPR
jgi:PAS domain S-box-containing protein